MKKIILSIVIASCSLIADSLNIINQEKDGYNININSKDVVVGSNDVVINIKNINDSSLNNNLKVKFKIFMPEMPGMPSMEEEQNCIFDGENFKVKVNFSMSGTWQYQLKFKNEKNDVITYKNSINVN